MKTTLLKIDVVAILLVMISFRSLGQSAEILWQKTFGGSSIDEASSMDRTNDGGYVLAGNSSSIDGDIASNHGGSDFLVVKTDSSGILEWEATYGGAAADVAYDIQKTDDDGFIVTGYTASTDGDVSGNHGGQDFWVIKLNSTGSLVWQKCYGGTASEVAYSLDQTIDGGYVIAGTTRSNSGDVSGYHGAGDYWIIKIDGSGNLQWQKCYGGSANDFAHAISQSDDGGYVVSGYARSGDGDVLLNYGQEDMWILKLNADGNIAWQKSYGGTGGEGASSLQQTSDGGYILTGITHSFNVDVEGNHVGAHDFWVVKIDNEGTKQWAKCFGGSDTEDGHCVRQTNDGGYLVVGKGDSGDGDATYNHGLHDFWVIKINSGGNLEWQKSMGGSWSDEANSVMETSDGNVMVAGYAMSNNDDVIGNHGGSDFWMVKIIPPTVFKFYADADKDTYGDLNNYVLAASAPISYVDDPTDCNDSNPTIHPNRTDLCNGIDDDCDGYSDEDGFTASVTPLATVTICEGSILTLHANSGSGYRYQWKKDSVLIEGATNSNYDANSAGLFSVVNTRGSCVANSPSTIVKVTNTTAVSKPQDITSVCPKTSVMFSLAEKPGMLFQWKNSSGIVEGATNNNFVTTTPGTYYATLTDITGCSFNSTTSTLQNLPKPKASVTVVGDLNICNTGSVKLKAYFKSEYTYQWYKDGLVINGATGSAFVATEAGAYKYLATTLDGCTAFSTPQSVVSCKMDEEEHSEFQETEFSVYPNPSRGQFTVTLRMQDFFSGKADIKICNSLGQTIDAEPVEVNDGILTLPVSLPSRLPEGIYFVRAFVNEKQFTKQFIISY